MRPDARLLGSLPLFQGLVPDDLDLLIPVTRLSRYSRGDQIFREGDPSDLFLVIAEGRVKLTRSTPAGRELILHVLGSGDPLGAVAVYDEMPYPASAVALDDVACVQVHRADLFGRLEEHPRLVRGLLKSLTRRLMDLTLRLTELSGGTVEQRLARLLLHLASDHGRAVNDGLFVPLRLSRQELADLTGTTIETCIRIMSRWAKTGLVETRGDGFLLLDPATLHELGEG